MNTVGACLADPSWGKSAAHRHPEMDPISRNVTSACLGGWATSSIDTGLSTPALAPEGRGRKPGASWPSAHSLFGYKTKKKSIHRHGSETAYAIDGGKDRDQQVYDYTKRLLGDEYRRLTITGPTPIYSRKSLHDPPTPSSK